MPDQQRPHLKLRGYLSADRDSIKRLNAEALKSTETRPADGPWNADLDRIEEVYLRAGSGFIVAEADGEVVGMGALTRISDEKAEIKRMRVLPSRQRQGIGQAILEWLESRAGAIGYTMICLSTTSLRVPAQRFYERNGYEQVAARSVNDFQVIEYEKTLGE